MTPPLVMVGMPARNVGQSIELAIASVIAQTYPHWRLLIADDGSDDDTVRRARSFRDERIIVLCDGERHGVPRRRNEILSKSEGTYMAWADADDISYPRRFETEVARLEATGADLVSAGMIVFRAEDDLLGKRTVPADHDAICRHPYAGFPMAQPTFMGRLDWFRRHGYDERAKRPDDQDLLLRSFRTSRFAGVEQILVGYRETTVNLRKTLLGRTHWMQSVFRDARKHRRMRDAVAAGAMHLLKAWTDVFAVTTHLNYSVLRHRARPLTESERLEWARVLDGVRAAAAAAR